MNDGMDEHRKSMREVQLKKLSGERLRCLRSMETSINAQMDQAPLDIEIAALLQIGRDENYFQGMVASTKYRDLIYKFNRQPWYQRVWQAWKGIDA